MECNTLNTKEKIKKVEAESVELNKQLRLEQSNIRVGYYNGVPILPIK